MTTSAERVVSLGAEGDQSVPKIVKVTPAQVKAAKMVVKRSVTAGKPVRSSVTRIANAKRATGSQGARRT